jgi:thiamine-phosphate pyrophosphorylase
MVAPIRPPGGCHTVPGATPADRRARLERARLYFVADRAGLERALDGALAGGADLIQLRDKRAGDRDVVEAAAWARERCARAGALLILNDRPDLAVAVGADGVHVGQDDMPVAQARALVGEDAIVGLSTHSIAQADAGARSGADYIAVGPVHATPTKEGRPAIGLEPIRHAAAHVADLPWFAIGGIDPDTVADVVAAGAGRAVIVRAIAHAEDPEAVTRALRAVLERTPVGAGHGAA